MLTRKLRHQCMLMPVLIVLMFSGSLYLHREQAGGVVYVKATEPALSMGYVTKSMRQLGKMDEVSKYMVMVNQVPYCGAELLVLLLQKLQGGNSYRHVRLKAPATPGNLSHAQQEKQIDDVYNAMRNEAVPLSFDQQIHFINFGSFGRQAPTYINIIRHPIEKALSRYPNQSDLIQCVIAEEDSCAGRNVDNSLLAVPYFCGQDPQCLQDNDWALAEAKQNVEKHYSVVGVLDELNATLSILERRVPYFFNGVEDLYEKKFLEKFKRKKSKASQKVMKQLQELLSKEIDFYNFVKTRLFNQLKLIEHAH